MASSEWLRAHRGSGFALAKHDHPISGRGRATRLRMIVIQPVSCQLLLFVIPFCTARAKTMKIHGTTGNFRVLSTQPAAYAA